MQGASQACIFASNAEDDFVFFDTSIAAPHMVITTGKA